MRREYQYWIIGIAAFGVIVGLWSWQLPGIIAYAQGGKEDKGLAALLSSFGTAGGSIQDDLAGLQENIDADLKMTGDLIRAKSAQAAAIDGLKKKLEDQAAAGIRAATVPPPETPKINDQQPKTDAR